MWYTLYIECPCGNAPCVHKAAVFYSKSADFVVFNHCDFSDNCVGCRAFCEEYIKAHPDAGPVIGSVSHPLSP